MVVGGSHEAHMIAPGTGGTGHSVGGVVKTIDDSTSSRASCSEDVRWGSRVREGGWGGERMQ